MTRESSRRSISLRIALTAGAVLAVVLAACSSATPGATTTAAAATSSPPPSHGPGFATPEDAVRAYIAGVAAADVDAVLAASAVEDAATHFDFAAQAERLKLLQPLGNPGPAQYRFHARINRAYFSERLLSQTQALTYSLLASSPITANPAPADGTAGSAFAQHVDPAGLAGLEVVDVRPPNATLENDPKYRSNALAQAAIYGATDDAQRVALVKLGDSTYEVGFELLKYSVGWEVLLQNSTLAALPVTGVAQPITQDEFSRQTSATP